MENERIQPVRLTMKDSGETYELDFNRDAVRFAESRDFQVEKVWKFPVSYVPEFFFYSFRMHHKAMSRAQTDRILDQLGGLTPKLLERLVMLYQQAQMSNMLQDDEELEKNGAVTVEL